MKLSFKQYLIQEAPIDDFKLIGDFSKAKSFRDKRDRTLLTNPRSVERIKKKFSNSDILFDFYFVNTTQARNFAEVGKVDLEWVTKNLGEDVSSQISDTKAKDSIAVIFTNNSGSERLPMTPWIIGHRIGHAAARTKGGRDNYYYLQVSNDIISAMKELGQFYSFNVGSTSERNIWMNRKDQLFIKNMFQAIGTFRSAREKILRDWFEGLNELIAQYLTTGKIAFNKAPSSLRVGRSTYYLKQNMQDDANELIEMLARDLTYSIESMFGTMIGGIYVM